MAGRPIVIEFASNVRDYLRGTKDVERSTEDIGDSLKEASRDAERFEREFRDSMKDAERQADKSSQSMSRDFDRLGDDMGEVGKEGAGELRANLAEGLSSGNLEDVLQDTLGGVVGGLSGVVGGATAVFAGVAAIAVNQIKAHAERVEALAQTAIDSINALYDVADARWTQEKQNQEVQNFLNENRALLEEMRPVIQGLGLDYNDFVSELAAGNLQASGYESILARIVAEEEAQLANTSRLNEGDSKRLTDAQRLLAMFGEIDDERRNELGIIQRQSQVYDDFLRKTGQQSAIQKQAADDAERLLAAVEGIPETTRTYMEFILTGNGASYLDPGHANYSPGHVAIYNMHAQGG